MSKISIQNAAIASKFFNDYNIISFNRHFYLYNEGIWRMESDENTEAWITKEYTRLFSDSPNIRQLNEITKLITSYTYNKYRKEIKYLDERLNISKSINIKSGVLDLRTLEVKHYEKDGKHMCRNEHYQELMGTDELINPKTKKPIKDPSKYCSNWFEPKK
jgi:hypothetical protein